MIYKVTFESVEGLSDSVLAFRQFEEGADGVGHAIVEK